MKILIAVTNDERSIDAVEMVRRLNAGEAAECIVMSVAPLSERKDRAGQSDEQSFLDWAAHKAVSHLASEIAHVERVVEHGEPGKAICELGLERDVDLIVIGSHEKSVWDRIWNHSVTSYVLEHAHSSVLVVR